MADPIWPVAGQEIGLVVNSGPVQRCFVDDVQPPRGLVLGARQPVTTQYVPGATAVLHWCSPAGRHQLTTRMVRPAWDDDSLWELAVLEEPSVLQQRAFARGSEALPAELSQAGRTWRVFVVDLGEGGARCFLPDGAGLVPEVTVHLHLSLDGQQLVLPAEVLSNEPASDDGHLARLRFLPLGRVADVLHLRMMKQQRRARTVGRP